MQIAVISVPHTGTWFTIRLFTALRMRETHLTPAVLEDNTVFHGHMLKGTQVSAAINLSRLMPLVCPLRHPYRVEESWRRRGKDVSEMIECFRIYVEKFLPLNPYIMPVDSPEREKALRRMSASLGVVLKTDWPVVNGKCGTEDVSLSELNPSRAVRELVSEIKPFLARFYETERTEVGCGS